MATETIRRPDGTSPDAPDSYRLSQSPSHLLRRAQQYVTDIFARSGLSDNVTLRQTVLLGAVAETEGASQTELVRATGVDRSTLAEMVSRMESKGLLTRKKDRQDGRAKRVWLTDAGRKRLNQALPAMRAVDDALVSLLPRTRQQPFQSALESIVRAAVDAQLAEVEEAKASKKKAPRTVKAAKAAKPAKKAKKRKKKAKR